MRRFLGTLVSNSGAPQAGTQVKVFLSGTSVLAAIFDQNGVSISNPMTTDANGQYGFNVLSGVYDITDGNNNMLIQQVQIFDFKNLQEWLSFSTLLTSITKPAVTGSKSSNAAITSLLGALATLGLITDQTTP